MLLNFKNRNLGENAKKKKNGGKIKACSIVGLGYDLMFEPKKTWHAQVKSKKLERKLAKRTPKKKLGMVKTNEIQK